MIKLQAVRGTKDLFRDSYDNYHEVISVAKSIADVNLYEGLDLPIIEHANIFDRTLGVSSDVVSKEMYVFEDKGGGLIALRPEFTASVIRAFITNGWQQYLPLKLFSYGPVFRYDRPQAGRQRQFHQLNYEHLGTSSSISDAQIIRMAKDLSIKLGIEDNLILEVNSLGCFESRKKYNHLLFNYFSQYESSLSEDSKKRLNNNPLRILDSKDSKDKEIIVSAPIISDSYTIESSKYFESVLKYLDILEVKYLINNKLVRGLDYYCHTSFEFTTDKLGAQNTVIAGGRYDGLCKSMGGIDLASIGFAAGIERIALLKSFLVKKTRPVTILPLDDSLIEHSLKLINIVHSKAIKASIEIEGKIDKRIKKAISLDSQYIIFIGQDEKIENKYRIKDLDTRIEIKLSLDDLLNFLQK
jgi:histidyl-tRNA synthetase